MAYLSRTGIALRLVFVPFWIIGIILLYCPSSNALEDVKIESVSCDYSGIYLNITSQTVFKGTIYPKLNYFNPLCRFSAFEPGTKNISFFLPLTDCGNLVREDLDIYVSNTIIVQKHLIVETDSDFVTSIVCKLPPSNSGIEKDSIHENHPTRYWSVELEAWMDLQLGKEVLGFDISNKLLVGDEFMMVIHVKNHGKYKDMQVNSCWAYDGETVATSQYILEIYNSYKCGKNDWISGFTFADENGNLSDSVAYGTIKAFKFPVSNNVHFTCSIEACTETCFRYCEDPENESNYYPKISKRATPDAVPDKSLRERHKLMLATIKALGSKLMEKNRRDVFDNKASFSKRTPDAEVEVTTAEETSTSTFYVTRSTARLFNLTNNVMIFTGHEFNFRREYDSISPRAVDPANCVPKIRFGIVTASLCFALFCLIVVSVGLILHIRKQNKKHRIDNFLLYNLR